MRNVRRDLADMIDRSSLGDGLHASPVPGVRCIKRSQAQVYEKQYWHASVAIVAQGYKEIAPGRDVYRCDDAQYIVTPIGLPVTSRIMASPATPFLCLWVDFDLLIVSDVVAQVKEDVPHTGDSPLRGVFVGTANDHLLEAAMRLGRLFDTPDDAPVLGPLVIKELFYHLLKGPDGAMLRQFVRSGSSIHNLAQAIWKLTSDLREDVDVTALAKGANMSRSAFYKHFKAVTALSPIQYQKRLRLLEARRLMVDVGETAEGSAFKVGYKSASQFSREYARMFGNAPRRHAMDIRRTGKHDQAEVSR